MSNTLIALVLDRSGSMGGLQKDVVGGVNNFIKEQQKLKDDASLTIVRFDTEYERFRPTTKLAFVEPLTEAEFQPRGGTALLDAIGRTVNALDSEKVDGKFTKVILVVFTDGQENSSKEFKKDQIKAKLEARQADGWTLLYLGANVDAFAEASAIGIGASTTAGYTNTYRGINVAYNTVSASVGEARTRGMVSNLGVKNLGESA